MDFPLLKDMSANSLKICHRESWCCIKCHTWGTMGMISVQVLTVHYLYTFCSKGARVVALDGFWGHLLCLCWFFAQNMEIQLIWVLVDCRLSIAILEHCQTNQSLDRVHLWQFTVLSHLVFAYHVSFKHSMHCGVNVTVSIHMIHSWQQIDEHKYRKEKWISCIRVWCLSWKLHDEISGKKHAFFFRCAPIIGLNH